MDKTYLAQVGTFSKANSAWGLPEDVWVVEGKDENVRLNDGKWYLDWISGLGSNLLGYSATFLEYVGNSIKGGTGFSLPHHIEYEVAEKLVKLLQENVPGWSSFNVKARFCKTGSEATAMAVRLARAITGRQKIGSFFDHYHGWMEWAVARTQPAYGVLNEERWACLRLEWDNLFTFDQSGFRDIAAVIFEHPSYDVKNESWYKSLQEETKQIGSLLIADEIVTGLRYGLGGACGLFDIQPDLICVGKALGNGFPINTVVGPAEYLDWFNRVDPVFCSSTHWGETASLYAADYVLDNWKQKDVDYIWKTGDTLLQGLRDAGWDAFGHPPRSVLRFKDEKERAFFVRYMFECGILMNRPNFPNLCHNADDLFRTYECTKRAREKYDNMTEDDLDRYVEGRMPKVLFSNR